MATTAVTADQVVVELRAKTSDYDARIANSAAQFEKKVAQMSAAAERAGKATSIIGTNPVFEKFGVGVDKASTKLKQAGNNVVAFDRTVKSAAGSTGNLAAQFNDIGVQLAGGQSPFLIALQQGSQINQVLSQMGGGGMGALRALGGAFTSLLNPVSLATIAIITLGGAAVQAFTEWVSSGELTEKQLKEQANLIKEVADKWGDALPSLKAYSDQLIQVEETANRIQAIQLFKTDAFKPAKAALDIALPDFADIAQRLMDVGNSTALVPLQQAWNDLTDKIEKNEATVEDVIKLQETFKEAAKASGLESTKAFVTFGEALGEIRRQVERSATSVGKLDDEVQVLNGRFEALKVAVALLRGDLLAAGVTGVKSFQDIAAAVGEGLTKAFVKAGSELDNFTFKMEQALRTGVSFQNPLGGLSPLTSGGGQFLAGGEALKPSGAGDVARWQALGKEHAERYMRGFEGFISTAKWDVNHERVGFGSDTLTDEMGRVTEVVKGSTTTLANSWIDLGRRIETEFVPKIIKAIGPETWKSLTQAQQDALTSLAYNYGSLPDQIVKAIQTGDQGKVAKAIASLTSNPGRRKEEAQMFLSGSGISLKEAGITTGKEKTPKLDDFERALQRTKEQTLALQAGATAQAELTGKVTDYGFAVAKAQKEQELLNAAQREGKIATADLSAATPEMRKQIEETATAYARATAGRNQLTAANQRAKEVSTEFMSIEREAIGGLISDLRNGVSGADALKNALDRVADSLINMALNSIFKVGGGGLFGGGGLLGGAIIPGILHEGGTAGRDGYGHGKSYGRSTWAGARRMHSGGLAGLMPGEVPAILQKGERVLPRGANQLATSTAASYSIPISIYAPNADAGQLAAVRRSVEDLGKNIPKMVDDRVNRRSVRKDRP